MAEPYLGRIGATALLACVSTVLSLFLALPLGILAAYHRGRIVDRLAQIVVANVAVLTRLTRSSVQDVLSQEFVTVAHAKGLSGQAVKLRHVLRNTYMPLMTVLGLVFANLMVGFAIAAGLIFTTMNLLVDVGIATLDPRVRSL